MGLNTILLGHIRSGLFFDHHVRCTYGFIFIVRFDVGCLPRSRFDGHLMTTVVVSALTA